jgi:hypothetical protein
MTRDDFATALGRELRLRGLPFRPADVLEFADDTWPLAKAKPDPARWAERFLQAGSTAAEPDLADPHPGGRAAEEPEHQRRPTRRAWPRFPWSWRAVALAHVPVVMLAGLVGGGYWLRGPAPSPEPAVPSASWFERRFAEIQDLDARMGAVQAAGQRLIDDSCPAERWAPAQDERRRGLSNEYLELRAARQRLVVDYNHKAAAASEWGHPNLPRHINEE